MFKRIKQFYINLTDKMTEDDYIYVESKLTKKEYILFTKLLKSEQKHSVRVAKDIDRKFKNNEISSSTILNNKDILIKASLLHDIGKIKKKVNIIDKSIIVILNKLTKGNLKKLNNKKVQCYYNHPEYSYDILKDINKSDVFLNIVRNHHKSTNDELILFFQEIDDNN